MGWNSTASFGFTTNGTASGVVVDSANNGLSLSGTTVVLGQNVGQSGNPAVLLSSREIPLGGFNVFYSGIGNVIFGLATSDGSKVQIQGSAGLNQSLLSLKLSAAYTNATAIAVVKNSADLVTFELRTPVNSGFTSTFLGKNSGSHCTSNTCIGIGEDALAAVTSATSCIGIGFRALLVLTTGVSNVAVGHASQSSMLTGVRNISMGRTALNRCSTGNSNIVFGDSAMQECASGDENVAIGFRTGGAMQGNQNIAVGSNAMFYQNGVSGLTRTSTLNIAIGYRASFTVQLGTNNCVFGSNANLAGILGDNNILIGANTDTTILIAPGISNTTLIGQGMTTAISNIAVLGRSDQNIILGVTNPIADNGARLQVNGNQSLGVVTSGSATLNLDATGTIYVFTGTTTTWTLPALAGHTGWFYMIKNRGSGILTLASNAGGNDIYNTSSVSSFDINPGEAFLVADDGTFWNIE
jgi:hypothetical protein